MAETALERVNRLAIEFDDSGIVEKQDAAQQIWAATESDMHPQERTREFHLFYDAPILKEAPDRQFSHMDSQRIAFRVSFLLSEMFELLNKGLGINIDLAFTADLISQTPITNWQTGDSDADLCHAIEVVLSKQDFFRRDIIEVADALGDLNVVVNGFALELGLDMDAIDQEIMASNFTKLGEDGQPIIGNGINGPVGKVLKGPHYMEPNIEAVIYGANEPQT